MGSVLYLFRVSSIIGPFRKMEKFDTSHAETDM